MAGVSKTIAAWEIPKKISLLAVAILFLFTFFTLILDAPRTYNLTYSVFLVWYYQFPPQKFLNGELIFILTDTLNKRKHTHIFSKQNWTLHFLMSDFGLYIKKYLFIPLLVLFIPIIWGLAFHWTPNQFLVCIQWIRQKTLQR